MRKRKLYLTIALFCREFTLKSPRKETYIYIFEN